MLFNFNIILNMGLNQKMIHTEECSKEYGISCKYDEVLRETESQFQKIKLVSSKENGLILLIDDIIQLMEYSEFQYHEPLAYYPILSSPNPKKVLVIGGGDLGVVNYCLKFNDVEYIDFVELDEVVIDFAKQFLKPIYGEVFFDKRVNTHISDGRIFVSKKNKEYDVIIMDMTDPTGPSKFLYTKEFFELVKNALKPDGLFSMHTLSPDLRPNMFGSINRTLKSVFSNVNNSFNYVKMYGGLWSYAICGNIDISKIKMNDIDNRIKSNDIKPKLLDSEGFFAYLHKPEYIKEILNMEHEIILDDKPLNIKD